jgi:hypothetical protein
MRVVRGGRHDADRRRVWSGACDCPSCRRDGEDELFYDDSDDIDEEGDGDFYDDRLDDSRERDDSARRAPPPWDMLVAYLTTMVGEQDSWAARKYADQLAERVRRFGSDGLSEVLSDTLVRAVTACWDRGWQPADLAHVVGRNLKPPQRAMLADIAALEAHPYLYADDADPAWLAQTAAVTADARPPKGPELLDHWHRGPDDVATVVLQALQLLDALQRLPSQPRLCPPPSAWGIAGAHRHTTTDPTGSRRGSTNGRRAPGQAPDPKVMQRVRALLAKAESTGFPEEAEAFTAKAQELIARHAIDQAMLEAGAEVPRLGAAGRRVLIDDPYAKAKSLLLGQVVAANRCTAVWQPDLSLSTVFGLPNDLDAVELLFTSLLTQATAAMVAAGRTLGSRGRGRAFRQSFLVAFASRIGERLLDANQSAVDEARHRHGDDVLPVLANREEAAEAARTEAFPRLRKQRISTSNYDGWIAGRAAADAARLGPEAALKRHH